MKSLRIALAGNANVGKSVLFNYLTGLQQHVGNWPGKTIEKAEGMLKFDDAEIHIIDLPGIYSLSTFSMEELVSRDYIAKEKPDVVVNVLDASVLERNLFFTLQLIELGRPVVIALNMVDIAAERGVIVDSKKMTSLLGVPVIPIVATKGIGVSELMAEVLKASKTKKKPQEFVYAKMLDAEINGISKMVAKLKLEYPDRWVAIKLLEEDASITELVGKLDPAIMKQVSSTIKKIENTCGHIGQVAISSERYFIAERVSRECIKITKNKVPLRQKLDSILLHHYAGYIFLFFAALAVFFSIFTFGDFFSNILLDFLSSIKGGLSVVLGSGIVQDAILDGAVEGIIAGLAIALPYLIPFYIILAVLEDSGYLARMAFLMDAFMHKIGLHGKAFIPIILAYGCNVPACLSCKILETKRDRLLAAFVVTLVPCAAVTVVVMGLVATYVGLDWALGLYLLNLLVILVLGRLAFKALPGEPIGLIMEMPSYKIPALRNVLLRAWRGIRSFVFMAFPIIIVSTFFMKLLELFGFLPIISELLSPVTVAWLGLPSVVGITLIFGILRKELALIMLAALLGTDAFDTILSPIQMITFAIVTMFYVPCAATIAALKKEHGWKIALGISIFEILFAIVLAGIIARVLETFVF